jgi:hypothetical protein
MTISCQAVGSSNHSRGSVKNASYGERTGLIGPPERPARRLAACVTNGGTRNTMVHGKPSMILLSVLLSLTATALWPQVGMEAVGPAPSSIYPTEWPAGPPRSSVPEWAKPGRIRFSRWDGGPIETAKAVLSGWPGFNPPIPDYLHTMTNWYDPRTVPLLREAGINLIWVTFSNGFSIPTEQRQREQLRLYIDECHRQGIHVMAYQSFANMFWEDMYEHVPESRSWASIGKDGKPVPYSAGDYSKMGRVTRYMANTSNPEWRAYLRKRIDLAIDAGADGVMYDNNFGSDLVSAYEDVYRHAASRKKDFLLMGNLHANTFVLNRLINCMTTEDGEEPGVYSANNVSKTRIERDGSSLLPLGSGFLINNIGLFRLHRGLSEGWKPVMIEHSFREVGQRFTTAISGPRHQLALAESKAFGVAMEVFVEGAVAHGLMTKDPTIMAMWRAIGDYNRFFADNEEYYVDAQSLASLAVVLDDRSAGVAMLNGLAARNVIYDVLYENDLSSDKLEPYAAVVLLTADTVRDRALSALESYVSKGGKLFAAENAATLDEKGRRRPRPAFFGQKLSNGECVYYDRLPALNDLASALRAAERPNAVRVEAPEGVLYNAVVQPKTGRVLVHLMNYTLRPTGTFKVTVPGHFENVTLLSPDSPRAPVRVLESSASRTEVAIPSIAIYSVLVLERARTR